jgi:hypothetical protein
MAWYLVKLRDLFIFAFYIKILVIRVPFGGNMEKIYDLRGPFEKFVNWRQCAAVMLLYLSGHNSGALPPVHELFIWP